MSKNLFCKNLRLRLPVRSPLYKNLFRLKFETGSCCLKSIKKFCSLGQIRLVNFQDPLWRHRCLIVPASNVMAIHVLPKEWAECHLILLATINILCLPSVRNINWTSFQLLFNRVNRTWLVCWRNPFLQHTNQVLLTRSNRSCCKRDISTYKSSKFLRPWNPSTSISSKLLLNRSLLREIIWWT